MNIEFDRDYEKHNEEVKKVWESYEKGKPIRMPCTIYGNNRIILLDDKLNTKGYTFEQYFNDPNIMAEVYCQMDYHMRHSIYADHEMGMPKDGWLVYVDRQNLHESGWLGAQIQYAKNNVPFAEPFLDDNNKNMLFSKPIPHIFDNFEGRAYTMYNKLLDIQKSGYTYKGMPIKRVSFSGIGTDGPMTLACMIRGTENFCTDLIDEPEYAHELLDYLVEAIAYRIKALREYFGYNEVIKDIAFADDSIALLSCDMYQEMIFPHHKKLAELLVENFETSNNTIHLCGDAQRHFKFLMDNLRVFSFDTGYPINFKKMVMDLGERIIRINGGVRVDDLMQKTPSDVSKETKRIMDEVMPYTDRFVMREANNLSPCTPVENIYAMYQTVREYGKYV
ncbi:MAG: uroporphyrinogen decarboxylase family protein [Clostridia bacterium]|nr:uroporphyrinogen decarboxylase family protein [Clostridia bacterium]MDD4542711.1 uroporphyrinogen decarboxylase family protein [Clostridia bacterium]HXK72683.1 uroporphyrinogen decarboxylase family protein [Clostridia bacterium]